jgi:formylmethanofuran dehydrogenase subunit A
VPFKYKDQSFVNALQWAIGLETFLLVDDPWRIFLTTDHPNGAPFTSYPHLIRLLMDRSFRNDVLATVHPEAQKMTNLASIEREYSLQEIAIMTRAGAARLIGLQDRGGLSAGNWADITVYTDNADRQLMFEKPDYVFKDGQLVVVDGKVVSTKWGTTHTVKPDWDASLEKDLQKYFDRFMTMKLGNWADITVYTDNADRQLMFEKPDYVFKDGQLVVVDGKVVSTKWGTTHTVKPDWDASLEKDLQKYFDRFMTMKLGNFKISDDEITEDGRGSLTVHPLKGEVA